MAAESASQEGSEPTEAANEGLAPDADGQYDLKRKFREALDRKRGLQSDAMRRHREDRIEDPRCARSGFEPEVVPTQERRLTTAALLRR